MTTDRPHSHHSEDAQADNEPPTDAVTDEVREAAAKAESGEAELDDEPRRPGS